MQSDYQSQKRQRTNVGSGTKSQCKQQSQVQQTYSYYQPVPEIIIQLSPQPLGSIPPPPPPRKSEMSQTNQQTRADDFSTMTQGTRGASIMGGQNEQAPLRIINTNCRNISIMHTHRRVSFAKSVTEPTPNTTGSNESDTNLDTCSLRKKLYPHCIHKPIRICITI